MKPEENQPTFIFDGGFCQIGVQKSYTPTSEKREKGKQKKKKSKKEDDSFLVIFVRKKKKFELYFERFKICRSEGNQRAYIVLFQCTDESTMSRK